ncbi:MAG: hypothetical protein ACRD9L_23705 [Bryobacteraceae bacterium]
MKWRFFAAAAASAWLILLLYGAPLVPVVAGTVLAGGWNYYKLKHP